MGIEIGVVSGQVISALWVTWERGYSAIWQLRQPNHVMITPPTNHPPAIMTPATSFGNFNSGLQAGIINGNVNAQFRKLGDSSTIKVVVFDSFDLTSIVNRQPN